MVKRLTAWIQLLSLPQMSEEAVGGPLGSLSDLSFVIYKTGDRSTFCTGCPEDQMS